MSLQQEDERGRFTTFIAGVAVGAGLATLYPPRKLKEILTKILVSRMVVGKLKALPGGLQDQLVGKVEQGIGTAFRRRSDIYAAIKAGREAIQKEKLKIAARRKG